MDPNPNAQWSNLPEQSRASHRHERQLTDDGMKAVYGSSVESSSAVKGLVTAVLVLNRIGIARHHTSIWELSGFSCRFLHCKTWHR